MKYLINGIAIAVAVCLMLFGLAAVFLNVFTFLTFAFLYGVMLYILGGFGTALLIFGLVQFIVLLVRVNSPKWKYRSKW